MTVGFLLEYYSNHAMENIGWMFTITRAFPLLLNRNLGLYYYYYLFIIIIILCKALVD